MKTNAVRLLDEAKIPYELRQYEVDPEDAAVAKNIGMPAEQVFKTLVVRGDCLWGISRPVACSFIGRHPGQ